VQSGLITNGLYVLVMDNLEFEVVGGTRGNPDRG
jgi:hypothetical protein